MNPLFSVISLNWNRKEDILRTLEGIHKEDYEPKEILVVDNGSEDGSSAEVSSRFPQVRLIALPTNLGVAGYNEGIHESKGEYVLLVDNDMDLLQSNTLQKIVSYFESNSRLGAVALQVRDQTRENLSSNNPKFWEEQGDHSTGFPCSAFDGGGVAFRKAIFEKVGTFIPEFFVYHSEVDLSTRIWDAGYEIRYFPEIAVSHRESPISRDPKMQTYYSTRNYFWYVWLYYPGSLAFAESFHFIQRSFLQNLRSGKPLGAWLKGVFSAVLQWPNVSHRRHPVRKETVDWMQTLRVKDRERKERAKPA
jgi:GT2 family glycosyltransferase